MFFLGNWPSKERAALISAVLIWPGAAMIGRRGWVTGVNTLFNVRENWPVSPMLTADSGGASGCSDRTLDLKYSNSKFSLWSLMIAIIFTMSAYWEERRNTSYA
uniref:Uncharacterized protein n=1 Tax=Bionectria ochroleuca TaxID=29856 RepID=A0A0B7KCG4_BIOOC